MFSKMSARDSGKEKRKTTKATLGVRKQIITEHQKVDRVSDFASKCGMPTSTISTSLKNKEMIVPESVFGYSQGNAFSTL